MDKYLNLDIWTPKSFGEEFGMFTFKNYLNVQFKKIALKFGLFSFERIKVRDRCDGQG